MAVKHAVLTLDGTSQQLSDALTDKDLLKFVSIQAFAGNSGVAYIGTGTVTALSYGFRIEIPVSSIPSAPTIIELGQNSISLSELSIIGTNTDKVSIFAIS